ncbi:MAG: hypothetical protein AAGG45_07140 [Pseudomonadota bacterium]
MSETSEDIGPYEAAWNQFVIEFRSWIAGIQSWMDTLSTGEKIIGISLFALAVLALVVMQAKAKVSPGSNRRQFSVALVLVVIFAFGAGWTLDSGSGSLSHLFSRRG